MPDLQSGTGEQTGHCHLAPQLGECGTGAGDSGRAMALYKESLTLRELGDKRGIALCLERLPRWPMPRGSLSGRCDCLVQRRFCVKLSALLCCLSTVPTMTATWLPRMPGWARQHLKQHGLGVERCRWKRRSRMR